MGERGDQGAPVPGRAFAPAASSPQAVSPVPASIPSAMRTSEAVNYIANFLAVGVEDHTKLTARFNVFAKQGLGRGRGKGIARQLSPADVLKYLVALRLNLIGLYPQDIIPAVLSAMHKPGDTPGFVKVRMPAALGHSHMTLSVSVPRELLAAAMARELHETIRRWPASAIDARSGETRQGLDPEGTKARPEGDAQTQPENSNG
jgi:hypothetical protein